jgi:hypothetical protein
MLVEGQAQQPAGPGCGEVKTVKDEVAEAIDNQLALVILDVLRHMRMPADHQAGTGVDHQTGQLPLPLARLPFTFPAPVHERNHQVGTGRARSADVGDDLAILAPGDSRPFGTGFEGARLELVVGQHGDAQAAPFDPQRTVRLGQLATTSEGGDAVAGEMSEGFEKSRLTVIAGMIVGHTERIESPAQNGQHARVGAEAENLVVERFPRSWQSGIRGCRCGSRRPAAAPRKVRADPHRGGSGGPDHRRA